MPRDSDKHNDSRGRRDRPGGGQGRSGGGKGRSGAARGPDKKFAKRGFGDKKFAGKGDGDKRPYRGDREDRPPRREFGDKPRFNRDDRPRGDRPFRDRSPRDGDGEKRTFKPREDRGGGGRGNGTQEIFWNDKSLMYASTHQMPLFPGTGATQERGEYDIVVNAPMHAGDGGRKFREAFDLAVLPRLEESAPELIVISAGFDAHWRDPLGSLELKEEDYAWVTRKLMDLAEKTANGRVVSVLEGGYDLDGLRESVVAHVATLMKG